MKMMAGVLVVTAVLLSACGTPPAEGTAGAVDPAELRTSEQALRGQCSVSVECADGTMRSCSGSSTRCAASTVNGTERVTCNGVVTSCPATPVGCRENALCRFDTDCGTEAACVNGICYCK